MRGGDEPRCIVRDRARHVHRVHRVEQALEGGCIEHRRQRRRLAVDASGEDLLEDRTINAGHIHLEHESIDLRFGQRVRAFELDRILRGEHEERQRQRARLAEDRDASLLHRFEQRRLCLGRCAIDLVREQQVGEDGPRMEGKLLAAVAVLENMAAGDVAREEVGRELDAAEVERQQPRERLHELCLAEARQAFKQDVAASEERGDNLVDRVLFTEDDPAQRLDDACDRCLRGLDGSRIEQRFRVRDHGCLRG